MTTLRRSLHVVMATSLTLMGAVTLGVACGDAVTGEGSPDGAIDEAGGGPDAAEASAPGVDAGKKEGGHCTPVKGSCDLVLQDCPDDKGQKAECVVTASGKGYATTCRPVRASQRLPIGRECCPDSPGGDPCLPGLSCIGDPCGDAGKPNGRCSPTCCPGDDLACEKSDPEGISGRCDVVLFAGNTEINNVCSYRTRCRFFGAEPCKPGDVCILEDKAGTASCGSSNGKTERAACQFSNDCASGLNCLGGGDAGACRMFCLTPNSNPPFDASAADGAPGLGGCNPGNSCLPLGAGFPGWLSVCAYPDGG